MNTVKKIFALFLLTFPLFAVAQVNMEEDEDCNCQLSYSEGMQKVIRQDKYGFRDTTGTLVIPYQYDMAGSFNNGRSIVYLNRKIGVIDRSGKIIIPCEWDNIEALNRSNYFKIQKGMLCGMASRDGEIIIPPKYQYISYPSDGLMLAGFDIAEYTVEKSIGFINMKGDTVIPFRYTFAIPFSEGFAVVATDRYIDAPSCAGHSHGDEHSHEPNRIHKYSYGIINTKGQTVLPLEYDLIHPFNEGMALISMDGKYGFINKKMQIVTGFVYDEVIPFKNGMARVRKGEKWGFVDKKGKEIIPCQYDLVADFNYDLAHVALNDKHGFVNKKGKLIVPLIYDTDKRSRNVYEFHDGISSVFQKYKYGYIDTKGKVIIPIKYHLAYEFSEGLAVVSEVNTYGFINTKGEIVIPFRYSLATSFSWGRSIVADPEKYPQSYYINHEGKCVYNCKNQQK